MRQQGKPSARLLYAAVAVTRLQDAFDRAQALLDEIQGAADNDPLIQAKIMTERGLVSLGRGDPTAALTHLQAAFTRFDELAVEPTPARAGVLIGLGRAWLASHEPARAEPFFDEASRFWETFDGRAPDTREAAQLLALSRAERRP